MTPLIADKELHPLELLQFGPVLMTRDGNDIQIEKLPEVDDAKE